MIAAAVVALAWAFPWSADLVEHAYSRGAYAVWQPALTAASNLSPWAALDPMLAVAAAVVSWLVARPLRRAARGRRALVAARSGLALVLLVAAIAGWFLLSWGLNYRRVPLATQLDHDSGRVDVARVSRLATTAVSQLNALHPEAHRRPWPDDDALRRALAPCFAEGLRLIGLPDTFVPGRSKRTALGPYFEAAGIAGFTNPLALDVVVSPAALPFERPSLLLHEWSHLAGLAHEAEAGFLGWLAGLHGPDQARYSAWLDLLPRLAAALPPEVRREVMAPLGEGPRGDYRAIEERLRRVRPLVRDVAWSGYERYLEANRVGEGLRSYDGVVGLAAGTAFDEGWRPRRR